MFDLMTTVSVLTDDIGAGVETLCARLGVPEPRPQAFRGGAGIDAVFCRVHPKYAVAPTFLELVAPAPVDAVPADEAVFPVATIGPRQGDRSIKWHATEIAMPEAMLLDLSEHLNGLDVPHGWVPADRKERFFMGGDPGTEYDRASDAGLVIEAGRSGHLGLPEEALTAPADIPDGADASTLVRIVGRQYLVDDLDETLSIMKRNLRWSPESVTEDAELPTRRDAISRAPERQARTRPATRYRSRRGGIRATRSRRMDDSRVRRGPRREGVRPRSPRHPIHH